MALFECGGDITPKVNCIFIPSASAAMSVCYEDGVRTAGGGASGTIFTDACGFEIAYIGSDKFTMKNITSEAITCYNRQSVTPTTAITIAAGATQTISSSVGLFIEF